MKQAVIEGLKLSAAVIVFVIIYGFADWVGGLMPMWLGLALVFAGIVGLVRLMIKIAKDGL